MSPDPTVHPVSIGLPAGLREELDEWIRNHNAGRADELAYSRSSAIRAGIRMLIATDPYGTDSRGGE